MYCPSVQCLFSVSTANVHLPTHCDDSLICCSWLSIPCTQNRSRDEHRVFSLHQTRNGLNETMLVCIELRRTEVYLSARLRQSRGRNETIHKFGTIHHVKQWLYCFSGWDREWKRESGGWGEREEDWVMRYILVWFKFRCFIPWPLTVNRNNCSPDSLMKQKIFFNVWNEEIIFFIKLFLSNRSCSL